MIHFVYNLAIYLTAVLALPYIALALMTRPKHRAGFFQKLGFFLPRQSGKTIWVHAVSVGEILAATELVKELKKKSDGKTIMVSTTTPSGREVAEQKLAGVATIFYFPYDFQGSVSRAVKAVNPSVLALVDTELWPNVIRTCRKQGAKVVVVNGRISDRSFPRYRRFSWVFRHALAGVSLFLMQSERDRERITMIGADPTLVEVPGNLKFDSATRMISRERKDELRRSIGLGPADKVIILGSVHQGEQVAIRSALSVIGQAPNVRLVIAPRRIDNIGWIEDVLKLSGFTAKRKSAMNRDGEIAGRNIVPVIDTFGELGVLYGVADVAFVGGSVIGHGGQNPLEPAAHGLPVLFGPEMSNFKEASAELQASGAAWTVGSEKEITQRLLELVTDEDARRAAGDAARAVVERNRGIAKKVAERILALSNE